MRTTLLTLALGCFGLPAAASAQMWFETDYLNWNRTNGSDTSFTGGVDSGDNGFDFGNGYRFILGGGVGDYEIEARFSRIDDWSGDSSEGIGRPLSLDGEFGNAVVFPGGAARLGFASGLIEAASGVGEDNEAEFLTGGSALLHRYESSFRDVQLNIAPHRDFHWFRMQVGYRGIQIAEGSRLRIDGTFNALDSDSGEAPGDATNEANDALSDAALVAAGFANIGGTADGFDAINLVAGTSDQVAMLFGGDTDNHLNGVHVTGLLRGNPSEFVTVEGFLQFGLFHNQIDASVSELIAGSGDDDSIYVRRFQGSKSKASFGTNLGLRTAIHLTEYISLTTGYELLVLSGIALAPDQYGRVQTSLTGNRSFNIDSAGVFLAHGGNVGLEIRW
jgi:hypothetical protein